MKLTRMVALFFMAIAVLLAAAGCSIASTQPDMKALHYNAGMFSSTSFNKCIESSTRSVEGPGDLFFEYPANVRTYDADNRPGAEAPPVLVLSSDNNEMAVPVSVKLNLITDNCDTLREFHERFGLKEAAYWNGTDFSDEQGNSSQSPRGWVDLLHKYIGAPLDVTLDRAAQRYTWRDLWNNPDVKAELERAVEQNLQATVDEQMDGHYFVITATLVKKPEPTDPRLKETISNEVNGVAAAEAEAAKAKAQQAAAAAQAEAARSQLEVTKAQAEVSRVEIDTYGSDAWLKKYGIDKGMNPWPAPIVAGGAPQPK